MSHLIIGKYQNSSHGSLFLRDTGFKRSNPLPWFVWVKNGRPQRVIGPLSSSYYGNGHQSYCPPCLLSLPLTFTNKSPGGNGFACRTSLPGQGAYLPPSIESRFSDLWPTLSSLEDDVARTWRLVLTWEERWRRRPVAIGLLSSIIESI